MDFPFCQESELVNISGNETVAIFGALLALLVYRQARRTLRQGGSFYDREVYGMKPAAHRRIAVAAVVASCACLAGALWPVPPLIPFVALETVAAILYLASFARGASYEDEQ